MHDEYDTLIDEAVKSYAVAEPSPELATSILRRAQLETSQRRMGWKLALALALPAAAIAIMAVVLVGSFTMPPAPPTVATDPSVPQMPAEQPQQMMKAAVNPLPARARAPKSEAARSAVRPLPTQYTKQELVLLSFAQRYPKEAAAIAEAQKQDMQPLTQQPITISRLKFAPLSIPVLNEEK